VGLGLIVSRNHHQARAVQRKTPPREEDRNGRRKKSCQTKSRKKIHREENGFSNRRISTAFIPPLRSLDHSLKNSQIRNRSFLSSAVKRGKGAR
jgi:hypothetical protein